MTDRSATPVPADPRPLSRPTLLPGLRRLWRGRRQLQLGLDPNRAVVLELPDTATARVLDLLDGTRSEREVLADAARRQIPGDAAALLHELRRAGLVVSAQSLLPKSLSGPARRRLAGEAAALALRGGDAPGSPAQRLRRRAAARVVVTGHGPLLAPVALTLAGAGVGHVWPAPGDPAHPRRRDGTLAELVARAAPGARTTPLRRREATFLVQIGAAAPATLTAAGYAQYRLAHLLVSVRDGTAVVGPLVPPAGRPCLNCLDLHRRDRDPQWPALAAQLAGAPAGDGEPCTAATVMVAAGLAAGEVLCWIDGGQPHTVGASIEVNSPAQWRRRSWPPHPRCYCLGRARAATGPPPA
ncbi:MAG TPA: TOMM precursor leader peptide-binding protein [Natronosporangium sp.]|nr:TOMM precursor leader peptide-binding protein [Natronosporangium sp.]